MKIHCDCQSTVATEEISIEYVKSEWNLADPLTKS